MKVKKLALLLSLIIALTQISVFAEAFGICTHVGGWQPYEKNIQTINNAGIRWIRDDIYWEQIESTKGKFFVHDRFKEYFREAKESGVKVLAILDYGNPNYTLSSGQTAADNTIPTSSEAEYMAGWKQYVRTVVEELGEYIDAYEVWNEPDHANHNATVESDMNDYSVPAAEYADLYINTKELLDELQPGKPVLFGAFAGRHQEFFDAMQTALTSKGKTFNQYIENVSIHRYLDVEDDYEIEDISNSLENSWENVFNKYGFTGNVWITETGYEMTTKDEESQGEYLPKLAVAIDKYLMNANRSGVAFWYDLRNDGTTASNKNHNFGIVDYNYNAKPSFYTMKARNLAVNHMPMINYSTPKTGTIKYWITERDVYGVLATYSDGINTTYVGYDDNGKNATVSVALSGEKAFVYDSAGNIIETIDNPTGTYNMTLGTEVTYVACVTPRAYINHAGFDQNHSVISVSGTTTDIEDNTLQLKLKDSSGAVVYTEDLSINDGRFETEFSCFQTGAHTITVGEDEITYSASADVLIAYDREKTLGDTSVSVSGNNITVTGIVNNAEAGETVSILVVPQTADFANLKSENIAYADDIEIVNGAYSTTFAMPTKAGGTYKIFVAGKNISDSGEEVVVYETASDYINVCDFDYTYGDNIIQVSTKLNNPAEASKSCVMVISQYDVDGILVKAEVVPITIEANTVQKAERKAFVEKIDYAVTARAFVWDGMSGMKPLVNDLPIILN